MAAPASAPVPAPAPAPGDSEFDRDTAITARPGEPGVFDAHAGAGWTIIRAVNGGYLLAMAARALAAVLPHPHPLTVTAHYLTPTAPGPAVLRAEPVRTGRTQSTGTVRLLQAGEDGTETERLRVTGTFGDLAALPDD